MSAAARKQIKWFYGEKPTRGKKIRSKRQEVVTSTFVRCLIIALTRKPAEPFTAPQYAKVITPVKKLKVFDRPFFKRVVRSRVKPSSPSADGETPYSRRSEKGEFKNSPVDCF